MNVQCMVAYLLKWHHACAKILGQRVFGVQELFVYSGCLEVKQPTRHSLIADDGAGRAAGREGTSHVRPKGAQVCKNKSNAHKYPAVMLAIIEYVYWQGPIV